MVKKQHLLTWSYWCIYF